MSHRIGVITPSSNTVLEPITTGMLAGATGITAHFSRFRVTEIALSDHALAQFANAELLRAATLLADARCDVIVWSGTSSGWLGFDADEQLCHEITAVTGVPSCTSVLALNEVLARTAARRLGLVTPYREDVQAKIIATYAQIGIEVVSEVHWGLQDNFSFSQVEDKTIADGIRAVATAAPDAIAIFCTNLRGAPLATALENELNVPIYDTVATALWKALPLCGVPAGLLSGWGRLFSVPEVGL
jgi:maleate isomerase